MRNASMIALLSTMSAACAQTTPEQQTAANNKQDHITQAIANDSANTTKDKDMTNDSNAAKAVVQSLINAMNANDADAIRAAFADDASQAYGEGAPKSGDEFRAWLESDIIKAEGSVANPEFAVDGDNVVVTGTYSNNQGYTNAANFLLTTDNGKITSWTMRY